MLNLIECYNFFQRCEQRVRPRKPLGGLAGTAMGDLEGGGGGSGVGGSNSGMGAPGVGRRARRGHHQPPFPKAVSIIDTLSELAAAGPEVRRLAQEQRPRIPRAQSGGRSSRPSNAPTGGSDEGNRPPGPPVVSPDFQQYTEKIYDAVTSRRPDPPSLRPGQRGRSAPGHIHGGRRSDRCGGHQGDHHESSGENREDEEQGGPSPKIDQNQLGIRGRERGRTPDWIKRIFDIAKKGDLPALVSC